MMKSPNQICIACGGLVFNGADLCSDCAVAAGPRARATTDEQLATDLRRRVGVSSMDSMPATYTATLVDGGRTFRVMEHGDNNEDESTTAERAVIRVVAQALAARKAGG